MMNTLNKYVLEELGNDKISNITTFKLQKFFSNLKSKYTDISDKTIYRIYKVLKNMFNRAMEWGYISNNPIDKVKIRRIKSKETAIYSYEELIQILSLLKKENIVFNTIFSLIITTGIRKCELLGLNVEDVDFTNGTITINKNMNWNKFNQILSLYTNKKFVPKKEIEELYEFIFKSNNNKDYKQGLIKNYIDNKYPIFKTIDISNINIDNVWDWLEIQKERYGNEFVMISLV